MNETAVSDQQLQHLVRSVHPEKAYPYLPGMNGAALAGLYGVDEAKYLAVRERFDDQAREAAEELLAEPGFAARVEALPFRAGHTIAGVGESTTDDLRSWLEILRHLLTLGRPGDAISTVNSGISGQTTTQALATFGFALASRPDWIICMIGGNDAQRVGRSAGKTAVGIVETTANLGELRAMAGPAFDGAWMWIPPNPVDESRVRAYPPFQQGGRRWEAADVRAVADAVHARPEPAVDLAPAFGTPPAPELLEDDGLHPSLAGQQAIARALVQRLT